MKLIRSGRAYDRLVEAMRLARDELIIFALASVIMLYIAATGIYFFENEAQPESFKSIFHCLWWAVTTMTTVGYGDMYPVTPGGKAFTFVVLMIGMGVIAVPTGIIASTMSRIRQRESRDTTTPSGNDAEKA